VQPLFLVGDLTTPTPCSDEMGRRGQKMCKNVSPLWTVCFAASLAYGQMSGFRLGLMVFVGASYSELLSRFRIACGCRRWGVNS